MGFLSEGNTLSWEEASERPIDLVRRHGILQFLVLYNKLKDRTKDCLLWGDEIEYIVVHVDDEKKETKLLLRSHEIVDYLEKLEQEGKQKDPTHQFAWRPEYARYMIEGTPGSPFGSCSTTAALSDLVRIEPSMIARRQAIQAVLRPNERVLTVTNYPLLGAVQLGAYTEPHYAPGGPVARSLFTPDEIIYPHFRFSTLTANIRNRRGSKIEIHMPLYKDENTTSAPLPLPTPAPGVPTPIPQVPYDIYMDSMAFGMGCCCLQCTFQCCNIDEARFFYDQLAVLAPIMFALTAATPVLRGYLADTDARWDVIAASVDDRNEEERGLKPLHNSKFVINKSRYDSIDCFISKDSRLRSEYNDINLVYDKEICEYLMKEGVDELLSRHMAHLFIRDPLVIYRDKLLIDDQQYTDHFENIQSTNWQTVRFKPPPPNSSIGWRVEFRPMEIQLTDFENAALVSFIVLVTRIIVALDLNFYIPLSKVDANMQTAHKRGAAINEKFYFRKSVTKASAGTAGNVEDEYELMTVHEIMNGKGSEFPGIIPLMRIYLDTTHIPKSTRDFLEVYLSFVSKRASGELMTNAAWIRRFVETHPEYKRDSVVNHKINHDLLEVCEKIGSGVLHPPELLGNFVTEYERQRSNNTKASHATPASNGSACNCN